MSHAELSPSAAHRWIACPGSVRLCRGIEREDSAFSREGTFAHEVAALALLKNVDAEAQVGMQIGDAVFDKEMAEHVQVYLDAVRMTRMVDDGELLVEHKVAVNDDIRGTADAILLGQDTMHVFDLKFGAGMFVSAHRNPQLMLYALGALLSVKDAKPAYVTVHVVQPRCPADNPWRSERYEVAEIIERFQPFVLEAAARTQAPDALVAPGEHCKFCPAKNTCPALRSQALAAIPFVDLDAPATKPPSPANMTPEQIATALAAEDLVNTWFKGCNEMAVATIKQGNTIPGWKLVAKQGLRKWNDDSQAVTALTNARVDAYTQPKIISPAEAEKRLAKTPLGKRGGEALVERLAHKPVTGEALVPLSDPRPAITTGNPFTPIET